MKSIFKENKFSIKRVLLAVLGVIGIYIVIYFSYYFIVINPKEKLSAKLAIETNSGLQQQYGNSLIKNTPNPTPSYQWSFTSALNSSNKLSALMYFDSTKNKLKVSIGILDQPINPNKRSPQNSTDIYEQTVMASDSYITKGANFDINNFGMGYEAPLTWANNKNQLAVFLFDKIDIFNISVTSQNTIKANIVKTIPIPKVEFTDTAKVGMFYTGDDKKLFMYRGATYNMIEQFLYDFDTNSLKQVTDLSYNSYPVPNSAKIVSWGINNTLNVWDNGVTQNYKVPTHADGGQAIVFSPHSKYVCVVLQSSGSTWYEVYTFPNMKKVAQSYSDGGYCRNWVDDNNLVTKEYKDGYFLWYQINVANGEKKVLAKEYLTPHDY